MTTDELRHSSAECDGLCVGCDGTGKHPHAGTGTTEKTRVDSNAKCSWCDGDGKCHELHTDEENSQ